MDKEVPLTEEAFQVIRTAVVGPICVLQVPDGPLLTRQEVFDLQPRGGVAARLCAEPRCDLEATVSHSVVSGAESGPVPEALLTTSLLEGVEDKHQDIWSARAVTMTCCTNGKL